MCTKWDLEFAGMVGVGDQSPSGDGATACVCQVRTAQSGPANTSGGPAAGASLAAPITAAQAAMAAQMASQQRMQQQHQQPVTAPMR